jgi:hypothetical protein
MYTHCILTPDRGIIRYWHSVYGQPYKERTATQLWQGSLAYTRYVGSLSRYDLVSIPAHFLEHRGYPYPPHHGDDYQNQPIKGQFIQCSPLSLLQQEVCATLQFASCILPLSRSADFITLARMHPMCFRALAKRVAAFTLGKSDH